MDGVEVPPALRVRSPQGCSVPLGCGGRSQSWCLHTYREAPRDPSYTDRTEAPLGGQWGGSSFEEASRGEGLSGSQLSIFWAHFPRSAWTLPASYSLMLDIPALIEEGVHGQDQQILQREPDRLFIL